MKLSLILIICTAIQSTCIPPMHTGLQYDNWNDCMIAGYEQSLEFLKTSEAEQVNKNQIYVKFVCLENIEEENT
jgi:hypothetical protein